MAEVSTGKPARNDAIRATFMPCSASGIAQPRITSSISFGSRPGARAIASLITTAARSSGLVARSTPLEAVPTGVLTEVTITASRIDHLSMQRDDCKRNDNTLDAHGFKRNQHSEAFPRWSI